ncbi:MAG: DUF481 domain-containing protein, partial [Pirellulaceae bacterium]|nr:DUF481 domain-containing protein [Pirellulaceae bacterium]
PPEFVPAQAPVGTGASAPVSLAPTTQAITEAMTQSMVASADAQALVGNPPDLTVTSPAGPNWYYPWTWIPRDGWANSAELGINGSGGNANSFSIQAGTRFKRKTDANMFDFRLTHNRTQTNSVERQNNALAFADFDRYFGESRWTGFVKNGLEYDRFRDFDLRYNISIGLGYSIIKRDDITLKGRLGSGASREFGGSDDRWVPEALFGADYEHQWNKRNKWIARMDYFPEWGDFANYRIVSDVSWEMLWDETGNLSLKLGAIDRYDSTPNGLQPNDLTYSMLLLYKF